MTPDLVTVIALGQIRGLQRHPRPHDLVLLSCSCLNCTLLLLVSSRGRDELSGRLCKDKGKARAGATGASVSALTCCFGSDRSDATRACSLVSPLTAGFFLAALNVIRGSIRGRTVQQARGIRHLA